MRVLFDHGTPAPLQSLLTGHMVVDAKAQGWDTFENGDLLTAAEALLLKPDSLHHADRSD